MKILSQEGKMPVTFAPESTKEALFLTYLVELVKAFDSQHQDYNHPFYEKLSKPFKNHDQETHHPLR